MLPTYWVGDCWFKPSTRMGGSGWTMAYNVPPAVCACAAVIIAAVAKVADAMAAFASRRLIKDGLGLVPRWHSGWTNFIKVSPWSLHCKKLSVDAHAQTAGFVGSAAREKS